MTYFYLYKIVNTINNHYYYGVHSTDNLNDGYMGSGDALHKAYKKYGVKNFEKEILEFFDDSNAMFAREAEIVTQDLIENPECYNLCLGGNGYQKSHIVSNQTRQKISAARTGMKFTEDHIRHIRESKTMFEKGNIPWNKGQSISDETKFKISQKLKGKTFRSYTPLSDETKKKISESLKSKRKDH